MSTLLHCADLHLSSGERDYSLAVLNEIVDLAIAEKADGLIFAGDTFDSFEDLVLLEKEFAAAMKRIESPCMTIVLAGNHEEHSRKGRKIASYNLGIPGEHLIDIDAAPWRILTRDGMEFLAIPHQADYKEYTAWQIPAKKEKFRIAIAHATVADMVFTGPDDEEEKAGIMDIDLFGRFGVDYAAMGHIHSAREKKTNAGLIVYPGSSRVWRKGETGVRQVRLIHCADSITTTAREIRSAGQLRSYSVNLSLDGRPETDPASYARDWGPADWIHIELRGLVEGIERQELEARIKNSLPAGMRRLDIDSEGIESCAGISGQEIAKKFLELWELKKPADIGEEREIWLRARAIGLKKIQEQLEARQ